MQYSLGIDAGGTYTHAVILRDSDGRILDTSKAITTYPNLMIGIRNAIDKLTFRRCLQKKNIFSAIVFR